MHAMWEIQTLSENPEEMKEPLAFDNFQDFMDYVIREEIVQLQEGIAARSNAVGKSSN
jgi:hypothetical protein